RWGPKPSRRNCRVISSVVFGDSGRRTPARRSVSRSDRRLIGPLHAEHVLNLLGEHHVALQLQLALHQGWHAVEVAGDEPEVVGGRKTERHARVGRLALLVGARLVLDDDGVVVGVPALGYRLAEDTVLRRLGLE